MSHFLCLDTIAAGFIFLTANLVALKGKMMSPF